MSVFKMVITLHSEPQISGYCYRKYGVRLCVCVCVCVCVYVYVCLCVCLSVSISFWVICPLRVQELWQFSLTDFVCSQFVKQVSLGCAYCIHSVVSNQSQGIRNPSVFSSGNNIPWVMIQLNAVHQYNLGTTNTDLKMFGIQTSVFLQPECFICR